MKTSITILLSLVLPTIVHAAVALQVTGKIQEPTPTHFLIESGATVLSIRKDAVSTEIQKALQAAGKQVSLTLTPEQIDSVTTAAPPGKKQR